MSTPLVRAPKLTKEEVEAWRQETTYPRQRGARNRAHHRCLTLSFKVLPMNSPQNKDTKYRRVARLSAKASSVPCSGISSEILFSGILSCPEHAIPDASHCHRQTEAGSSPRKPAKENSASTWRSQTALQPWTSFTSHPSLPVIQRVWERHPPRVR